LKTLAEAVDAVHRFGLIHRDLKPSNILFGEGDVPKISDFGLALPLMAGEQASLAREFVGTPAYMAPEQAGPAAGSSGPTTDVYGLGAILYECLTGSPPFRGGSAEDILRHVRQDLPRPPRQLAPLVPGDLEAICLKCLHKEPGRRYGSARELADDLGRFLAGEPTRARPVGLVWRPVMWARRHPTLATLCGLVTLAVGLSISLYVLGLVHDRNHAAEKERLAEELRQTAESRRDDAAEKERLAQQQRDLALDAVAQMLQTGRDELKNVPRAEKVRRGLLEAAVPLLEQLRSQKPDDLSTRFDLGKACIVAGDRRRDMGEPGSAADMLRRATALLADLADENPTVPAYRAEHAAALQTLALALQQNGEVQAAEENYRQAHRLLLALVERDRENAVFLRYLAHTEGNLVGLLLENKKWQEAVQLNQQVIHHLESIPGALPQDRQRLGKALDNMGVAHATLSEVDLARKDFEDGQKVREQLVKNYPDELNYRADLGKSLLNLGAWYLEFRRSAAGRAEGIRLLRQAADIQERLVRRQPLTPEHAVDLALTLSNLAELLSLNGDKAEAEKTILEAARVTDEMADRFPHSPKVRGFYLEIVKAVHKWYEDQARLGEARSVLKTTVSTWQRRAELDPAAQTSLKELLALQEKLH
jgi:tetratricopeptide (TPR) repeat protein